MTSPGNRVLEVAAWWDGQTEEPGNRGPLAEFCSLLTIRDMRPYPTGGLGAPWCASFTALCGRLALGDEWPIPIDAFHSSVDGLVAWAKRENVFHVAGAERGDIFVIRRDDPDDWTHTGFVTAPDGDFVKTIEGNTNDDGSANGDGVYRLRRQVTERMAFIRWVAALRSPV